MTVDWLVSSWGTLIHLVLMQVVGWRSFVQNVTYTNFNIFAFLFIVS